MMDLQTPEQCHVCIRPAACMQLSDFSENEQGTARAASASGHWEPCMHLLAGLWGHGGGWRRALGAMHAPACVWEGVFYKYALNLRLNKYVWTAVNHFKSLWT